MKLSESTENIFKALSQFRKNIMQPKKDADNPQFRSKYVPLELVTDAIDKVAPNYGLAYFQNLTTLENSMVGVQTIITHESGEYIEFDWLYLDARPIIKGGAKGQATSQSQGSAITYGRRYSLSSAFGIASEVDDDGNEASGNHEYQTPAKDNQGNNLEFNHSKVVEEPQDTIEERIEKGYKFLVDSGKYTSKQSAQNAMKKAHDAKSINEINLSKRLGWLLGESKK